MKTKKKTTKKTSAPVSTALVLREVTLSLHQQMAMAQVTPPMFIKEKPGRGGKKVSYVEGGYVVSRLNAIFSPAGWDFKIIERGQTERKLDKGSDGEVWVYGELTIIDHAKGYRVTKGQYGQHPVHSSVPIGDAYKAATTDALKKCASLFGIAADVYWKIGEQEAGTPEAQKPVKKTSVTEDDMKRIRAIIKSTGAVDALINIDEKIQASPLYTKVQKEELKRLISNRVDELQTN